MAVASPEDAARFALKMVQDGMPTCSSKDSIKRKEECARERFDYVTKRCCEAPFLTLDKSSTNQRVWEHQKVRVQDAIGAFLPANVYEDFKSAHNLKDIQSVMDLHTFKDFTSNIFSHELSDSRRLVDVIFFTDPKPTTCTFGIHFIRLVAQYSGERDLVFINEYRKLEAEYHYMEFTGLTGVLQRVEQELRESRVQESLQFYRRKN